MLNNVLGYLCSKTTAENCQVVPEVTETREGPGRTSSDLCDPDDSKNAQYDIEDQDGWQVVCRADTRREPSENPSDADAEEGLFALAEEEDDDPGTVHRFRSATLVPRTNRFRNCVPLRSAENPSRVVLLPGFREVRSVCRISITCCVTNTIVYGFCCFRRDIASCGSNLRCNGVQW